MVRKFFYILVSTILMVDGKQKQNIFTMLLIIFYIAHHCYRLPYRDNIYNWLDGVSLSVTYFTLFSGYLFLGGLSKDQMIVETMNDFELTTELKWILLTAVIGLQILFFGMLFYQFLVELRKYIKRKYHR